MIAVGSDLDGVQTQNFAQPQPPQAARDQPRRRGRDEELPRRRRARRGRAAERLRGAGRAGARARRSTGSPTACTACAPTPAARSTRARCASSTRSASRSPTTGSWSPTCASPATGWPASTRPRTRASCRSRSAGARSATRSRPRSAPRWRARGPVVAIAGDGGFLYAPGELATVAQERIPLTLVIVDDGGYGMLRYDQDVTGADRYGVDLAHARLRRARALVRDPRAAGRRARRRVRRGARRARRSTRSRACCRLHARSRSSRRRTPRRTGTGASRGDPRARARVPDRPPPPGRAGRRTRATAAFPGLQDTPPGTAAMALAARADVGPEALDELVDRAEPARRGDGRRARGPRDLHRPGSSRPTRRRPST